MKTGNDITENKKMEEALRESEARFREVVEHTQAGYFYIDLKGKFQHVNNAWLRMHGYDSPDEIIGKHFAVTQVEADRKTAQHNVETLLSGEPIPSGEFSRRCKDGSVGYHTFSAQPILQGSQVVGLEGFLIDTTEKKNAGQEIKDAHQRLLKVLDSIDAFIYVADMQTYEVLFTNSYGRGIWGDITGKKCWQILQEGQTGPCAFCTNDKLLDAAGQPTGVYKWEFENTKNGRWHDCRDTALRWIDGRMVRLEMATDITDRKSMEDKLQDSEKQFRAIFEVASVGISQVDTSNGQLVSYNEKYCELTGYTDDELRGLSFLDLTHPEDRQRDWEIFSRAVRGETPYYQNEKRYIRKDGSVVWVRVNAAFIRDDAGQPIRTVAVCENITERKQAEEALEQLYRQLDEEMEKARKVHERTIPTKVPMIEGICLAAHYQPAQKLGGDFYDVIRKDNKLIFYLSDVSGHGLDGAMLSVFVKHTIKGYLAFSPASSINPANILRYLSKQFAQESYPEEYFICIFMAVLDLEKMELVYSGAGFQDTPLVRLGNGEQIRLASKGLFITSYLPDNIMKFHEESISLTPGTTIFFNTDGLTEQGNQGTYYMDRLPIIFYETAHQSPHLVAQAVAEDFRRFNNGSLQGKDDITFLVLQVDTVEKGTH